MRIIPIAKENGLTPSFKETANEIEFSLDWKEARLTEIDPYLPAMIVRGNERTARGSEFAIGRGSTKVEALRDFSDKYCGYELTYKDGTEWKNLRMPFRKLHFREGL